jgi:ketosteroid isomerase-like protein
MSTHPGHVPDVAELALRSAAQFVVNEVNARLDSGDLDGALELYAEDAVLEAVQGREAIRQTIMHTAAAGLGRKACHVISNYRGFTEDGAVVVDTTQIAFVIDGPPPWPASSVLLLVRYILKPSSDGNLRIVEQRVPGYQLNYG